MKPYDRWSSLFLLALSISVCIESLHIGVGRFRNPGSGFIAFGTSVLLGILSLVLFLRSTFGKEEAKVPLFGGGVWRRVILILMVLPVYAYLLPVLGYLIATFFLMFFLFWVAGGLRWWWVLASSLLTTLTSYLVFSVWLSCQFPKGLLGF
jgi:Tripartite tricarboxylate transporter TctB family